MRDECAAPCGSCTRTPLCGNAESCDCDVSTCNPAVCGTKPRQCKKVQRCPAKSSKKKKSVYFDPGSQISVDDDRMDIKCFYEVEPLLLPQETNDGCQATKTGREKGEDQYGCDEGQTAQEAAWVIAGFEGKNPSVRGVTQTCLGGPKEDLTGWFLMLKPNVVVPILIIRQLPHLIESRSRLWLRVQSTWVYCGSGSASRYTGLVTKLLNALDRTGRAFERCTPSLG